MIKKAVFTLWTFSRTPDKTWCLKPITIQVLALHSTDKAYKDPQDDGKGQN